MRDLPRPRPDRKQDETLAVHHRRAGIALGFVAKVPFDRGPGNERLDDAGLQSPFPGDGGGEDRDRSELRRQKRLARIRLPVPGRLEAAPELVVHLRVGHVGADEAAPSRQVDCPEGEQPPGALQGAVQNPGPVGGGEGVPVADLTGQADRIGRGRQLLRRSGVVSRDPLGQSGRRAGQVLLFERFEDTAVAADQDAVRNEEGHEGNENQDAGQQNEEPDAPPGGTPVHDRDIIAAASSHSLSGTDSSTRARPTVSSTTPAIPRAVAFLSRARNGARTAGSRRGAG